MRFEPLQTTGTDSIAITVSTGAEFLSFRNFIATESSC